jgi:hypothetical protein
LRADAGSGLAFIGSEQDLRIDLIQAAGEVRVKSAGSLINAASVPGATNVIGTNMIFESANGGIGLIADPATGVATGPLRINQTAGSVVTARAAGDIWIDAEGEFGVDTMFSRKDVNLGAGGSILSAFDVDLNILSTTSD